jgi:hypothetical protein
VSWLHHLPYTRDASSRFKLASMECPSKRCMLINDLPPIGSKDCLRAELHVPQLPGHGLTVLVESGQEIDQHGISPLNADSYARMPCHPVPAETASRHRSLPEPRISRTACLLFTHHRDFSPRHPAVALARPLLPSRMPMEGAHRTRWQVLRTRCLLTNS